VSGHGPGFVDVVPGAAPAAEPPARPVLMAALPGAPAVIEPDWQPALLGVPARASSLALLLGGVALLLLGWVGLSAAALVLAAFDRAPAYGWAAASVLGAAAAMIVAAGWREWRAWRTLARVDRLRVLLAGDGEVEQARTAALGWVAAVTRHLPAAEAARAAVAGAGSLAELRATLRLHVAGPLDAAAGLVGQRAAVQAAALVALCPHPALDGLLAGLCGLRLVREVAGLHGLRPGGLATLALGRRVATAAVGTAGVDLIAQGLADHLLQHLPGVRHLAAAVPGATLAAVRLYRLARVTAVACSPLAPPRG